MRITNLSINDLYAFYLENSEVEFSFTGISNNYNWIPCPMLAFVEYTLFCRNGELPKEYALYASTGSVRLSTNSWCEEIFWFPTIQGRSFYSHIRQRGGVSIIKGKEVAELLKPFVDC